MPSPPRNRPLPPEAAARAAGLPVDYRRAVCALDCPDTCSLRVGVQAGPEGERVVSVQGDPEHPITRGTLCGKVSRYAERVYSERRIRTPLRRTGPKGAGQFTPITWDEALDEIAGRWGDITARHGAQAILPFSYGGTIGRIGFDIGHRFFHQLGASRLGRTICIGAAAAGLMHTMGAGLGSDLEDLPQADLVIVWGLNAVATHVHLMPFLKEARKHGAHVVVIDAYRTATARQADEFVRVRPGTDAALALAMMQVLIAEDLLDRDFIAQYTTGFDALQAACADWSPGRAEAVTGVPAAQITALARRYGRTPRAFIRLGLGLSRHGNGGTTIRSIACLPALTGAWRHRGGGLLGLAWGDLGFNRPYLAKPAPDDPPARTLNMIRLGEALLDVKDPPVQALYVYNSNPAAIVPEQARVHEGLAREDLFTVVHEQVLTDTTDYADLVLPATTFLEHEDFYTSYGHRYVQLSRPPIAPVGEARSNLDVFRALAARLGLPGPIAAEDADAVVARLLEHPSPWSAHVRPGGEAHQALLAGQPVKLRMSAAPWAEEGLRTPSGRFELYSERLAAQGLPGAPAYLEVPEGATDAASAARYPLQLVTPPAQHFLNSTFGETPTGRRLNGVPRLKLHPGDAAARGLAEGAPCRVYNDRGAVELTVELTEDTAPGVAVAEGVWWPSALPGRRGINTLTSAELADLGEGVRVHGARVQVAALAPDRTAAAD